MHYPAKDDFGPLSPPPKKITHSKWIKDLTIRAKAIKLLGENICDLRLGKDLLDMILNGFHQN